MEKIEKAIREYFSSFLGAEEFFDFLVKVGDVYCMGGLLREYRDNKSIRNLRDADFPIQIRDTDKWEEYLHNHPHGHNRFGGWKFEFDGFHVDVWDVRETWGIKNGYVKVINNEYLSALSKSVYLNIDSIVYDLNKHKWADKLYLDAINNKKIDIVLEDNPYIDLNIMRAMIIKNQYNMVYSDRIKRIINERCKTNSRYVDILDKIQRKRYIKDTLSKDKIKKELEIIITNTEDRKNIIKSESNKEQLKYWYRVP